MAIRVGVLTLSDRSAQGERPDESGPLIAQMVSAQLGALVEAQAILPDDLEAIKRQLVQWADEAKLDLVLTTGGTGFAPRDVTPEATRAVIEREAPGLAEAMRAESLRVTPHAMLSRAVCGLRGQTLIINLPGSPKAARESLNVVLPVLSHAIALLQESPGSEAGHRWVRA